MRAFFHAAASQRDERRKHEEEIKAREEVSKWKKRLEDEKAQLEQSKKRYGELVSLAEELKSAEAKAKKRTIDVEEELRLMRLKIQEKEEESRRSIVTQQEQDVQGKISSLEKSLAEVSLRWPEGFGRCGVYLCFILHIQWS